MLLCWQLFRIRLCTCRVSKAWLLCCELDAFDSIRNFHRTIPYARDCVELLWPRVKISSTIKCFFNITIPFALQVRKIPTKIILDSLQTGFDKLSDFFEIRKFLYNCHFYNRNKYSLLNIMHTGVLNHFKNAIDRKYSSVRNGHYCILSYWIFFYCSTLLSLTWGDKKIVNYKTVFEKISSRYFCFFGKCVFFYWKFQKTWESSKGKRARLFQNIFKVCCR